MKETAKHAAIAVLVVLGVLVLALALWKLKLILALLFVAFIVAAAMRPGVDALARHGVPRGFGVLLHYLVLGLLIAAFLWILVPRAVDQVDNAVSNLPATRADLGEQARDATGIKHDILLGLQRRLQDLPTARRRARRPADRARLRGLPRRLLRARERGLLDLGARAGREARLLAPAAPAAQTVRDTWELIDLKLGAYVRGQALLIVLVGDGALDRLLGDRAAVLAARRRLRGHRRDRAGDRAARRGSGGGRRRTDRERRAGSARAGVGVLVVRLLEDYLVIPRLLGDAVGLTPLVVLLSVTATGRPLRRLRGHPRDPARRRRWPRSST